MSPYSVFLHLLPRLSGTLNLSVIREAISFITPNQDTSENEWCVRASVCLPLIIMRRKQV